MSDEALTQCPKCGGRLERLIGGGVGIIMKGGNGGHERLSEHGGGRCGRDLSQGTCCGRDVPCDSPPCKS